MEGKKIIISHGWSDFSVNFQSKYLALQWSEKNDVIFLDSKKKGNKDLQVNKNLRVLEWPGKRPVGFKDFLFAFKVMRKFKPDLVITNFASNDIVLFVSWMLGVKKRVCYFHTMVQQHLEDFGSLDLRQRINISRKGIAFRKATHLIAPSAAAKKDLVKYYKVNPAKVFVFPNAIEDTAIRNSGNSNRVGFLGRLSKSKGVDILISAFKKIHREFPDAQLHIAGNGIEGENLRRLVEDLDIQERVFFIGSISANEVRKFMASLNFLVVPSRMDNLPTVALEALSTGTPVIGSDSGGIPDIIKDGYNGLLFKNENINDLCEKMEQILSDKNSRQNLSMNARTSFEDKFSIHSLMPGFEQLINNEFSK